MSLSNDLISQFVKVTKDDAAPKKETTLYGTAVVAEDGNKYVKLDGSDLLTPISSTTEVSGGERVTVMIKDHNAVITGNITSPSVSAGSGTLLEIGSKIEEFDILIGNKVNTTVLNAEIGRIDNLVSENITIRGELDANKAKIDTLESDNVTINEKLTAQEAEIQRLDTEKLTATDADIKYATIDNLSAANANINNLNVTFGNFQELTTDKIDANKADIDELKSNQITTDTLDAKYANIEFTNIGEAAIREFFSKSGMIGDLVVSEGTVTGSLITVKLKGDLIEAGTLKADRLIVKGTDGNYYNLNLDGMDTSVSIVEEDQINGKILVAQSITAEKIRVDDLAAFEATIGGFVIDDNAIRSTGKGSADSTVRGIYLDNDGQFAVGDSSNYFRYYRDSNGDYRLELSAASVKISTSNKTVEEELNEIRDEVTTNLRIESSRGTVFKNDNISTVLSAVIYRGSQRITNITDLRNAMGNSARLQWKYRLHDDSSGVISDGDARLSNGGFSLSVSPEDVSAKVTFICELITE